MYSYLDPAEIDLSLNKQKVSRAEYVSLSFDDSSLPYQKLFVNCFSDYQ